jgi:hypothetical protein
MDKSNAADKYVNMKAHEFMYVMQTDVNLSYPLTGLDRPLAFREVDASIIPIQSASKGGKFVSRALRPHFFLSPEDIPGTHIC